MFKKRAGKERFWEIDFLRGVAIVMMITFHVFFDLSYFKIYTVENHYFWELFPVVTASIFIFLVGLCLTISYARALKTLRQRVWVKYVKRGVKTFILGMFVTIATFAFLEKGFIIFGVLHFIGLSVILAYPFLNFKTANLFFGLSFFLIGTVINNINVDFPWLIWMGIAPQNFSTLDYFPIFPWFGVVLFGIFAGNLIYPKGKRRFNVPELSKHFSVKFFCLLGRNSLLIYFLHQILIVSAIYLVFNPPFLKALFESLF